MTTTEIAPAVMTGAADPTTGFRRVAGALALPTAFACQLVVNATYAWTLTSSGLTDSGTMAETQALYRAFPGVSVFITTLALVGVLLAVPGLLAGLRVLRAAKPRLALWSVVLMVLGYLCYFGMNFVGYDELALTLSGADLSALDTASIRIVQLPYFLLFAIGNLLGTLLLGLAVILGGRRARVPRWSGILIIGWTIGHVINIAGGGEWFAVAGGVLEVVGLSMIAATALRTPNGVWASRG